MTNLKLLKQLAQEALDVQDACNLSGVIHGFSRAATKLREAQPNLDTAGFRDHPIVQAWLDKIAQLGFSPNTTATIGFEACRLLAERPIRDAVVEVPAHKDAERCLEDVQSYLPKNYSASLNGDVIEITGQDNAGWTLDGYVLPRLASGLIIAKEL